MLYSLTVYALTILTTKDSYYTIWAVFEAF